MGEGEDDADSQQTATTLVISRNEPSVGQSLHGMTDGSSSATSKATGCLQVRSQAITPLQHRHDPVLTVSTSVSAGQRRWWGICPNAIKGAHLTSRS